MSINFDLDDVASTSATAMAELAELRGKLVAVNRRCARLEDALRLASDEPNIDRARAIADKVLRKEVDGLRNGN